MVKTLLKDYNEIEEHKKSQLPQTLTIISEVKQNNINPEQNVLEKSKNLVDGVVSGGGVKAEAQHYYYAYRCSHGVWIYRLTFGRIIHYLRCW